MFPPLAPRSAEEAPLALVLLKSPSVWKTPPRAWGTTERPQRVDQSFMSVISGTPGPTLVRVVSATFCGEIHGSPPGSNSHGVLA